MTPEDGTLEDGAKPTRSAGRSLLRFIIRQTLLAIPFAVFFNILFGKGLRTLLDFYVVSVIFAWVVAIMIVVNRALVLPRILSATRPQGRTRLVLEIGSFALASIVGSIIAGVIVDATLAHGQMFSMHGIATFLSFTLLFSALFLGWIYAARFQRKYTDRIRWEAEANAKEEQELRIAGEIQRALQPGRPRVTKAFAAAGAAIACRTIGGDFFDYFDLSDGRLGFVLGDVAGKGPPAALLAAMVQGIFTSNVADGQPARTVERVNRVLNQRIVEGRFATAFYAVLSPNGRLVSCNAGNNPPFLLSRDGSVRKLEVGGLPIGPFTDAIYGEEETPLRPGDTLVLYSDGVSDAAGTNDESFGDERLLECLGGACGMEPEALIEHVLAKVRAFSADLPQFDDITLLVVRYAGEEEAPTPREASTPAASGIAAR
ncbi:MAG TPA: PP2C family protein-serine/threonine phosphatase [Candidatus Binatia bacterium]|nr:PP2C family protein-serine/threonine phosphatase [Candidatus Binatia bacterium]